MTTGTLFVNANVPATVTVFDSDDVQVGQRTNVTATNWTLEAGDYTVQAAAQGYGAQSEPVTITAGQSSTVNFSLLPVTTVVGNVASVEIVGFVDENGDTYDWNMEVNPVKDATLVAAQTEEQVGVVVRALDADGDPVAGVPVTISITGDFSDALAIYPGKVSTVMPSAAQTFQGLTTDADGYAYFVIEATNAFPTWQDILNDFGFFGPNGVTEVAASQFNGDAFGLEPVKLIVSSLGGDMIAKRSEFKAWFVNMSHLWYGEAVGDMLDEDSLVYTDRRIGGDLGEIFNVWGVDATNRHDFGTFAITKQPTSDPFAVGYDMFEFFESIGMVPANPWFGAPGYMVYTMSGDTDLVAWDNCDWVSTDGLTCEDAGSGVSLVPIATVSLEDLPISVTIDASYMFEVPYGPEWYEFELKSYTFTKTWVGGFLEVDKYVDQHVLTWYGADVTLLPTNAVPDAQGNYLSTVHVTVTNGGEVPIYNVSVRDVVPAELGVITTSISDGGTYDAINHAVTWTNVVELDVLDPDETKTVTFDVYARHKPGYCWTDDAVFGDIRPIVDPGLDLCAYADPYVVTNGAAYLDRDGAFVLNAVTAAGSFEDSAAAEQIVFPYRPVADESDIWVVRPLFDITKLRISPATMAVGAVATFEIDVTNVDRVALNTAGVPTREYGPLYTLYPWEFFDNLVAAGAATGHYAATTASRANAYGRNIAVSDHFDYALDFTQGVDFDGSLIVATSTKVVGKSVTFDPIADLPMGDTVTGIVRLTGQQPSDVGPPDGPTSVNGSIGQLEGDPDWFAWQNCAYLGAPQLNQPEDVTGLWYDPVQPWLQDQLVEGGGTPLVVAPGDNQVPAGVIGLLEDCAVVAVIPPPPAPLLGINVDGEHESVSLVDDSLVFENRRDVFALNENFVYVYSVENGGLGDATDVQLTYTRLNNVTTFIGPVTVYRSVDGGFSWTLETGGGIDYTSSLSAGLVSVSLNELNSEEKVVVLIPARATSPGEQIITYRLTAYTTNTLQSLPLTSTDSTTVGPSILE